MSNPALVLRGIRKSYYGNVVLQGVDLEVRAGEIHALVGENGAGKSTLMNILFGMPVIHETGGFEGTIELGGTPVVPATPSDAMAHGVGMVHQEFMLLPGFTVAENIKLAREPSKPNVASRVLGPWGRGLESLDLKRMKQESRAALDRIGMSLDEWRPVAGLPVGHMQFVEIAREVDKENARLLVFDEPTAVLTESEAEELLATMKALAGQGIAILFITHRLDEVLAVADRITVLRDGAVAGRVDRADATVEKIAELMIGRALPERNLPPRPEGRTPGVALHLQNLVVEMPGEEVRGVDLDVQEGEILGVAGLAGQGKLGIANGVLGLFPATGTVETSGSPLPLGDTLGVLKRSVAFVSEDRRQVGLLLDESIETNIAGTAAHVQGRFLKGSGPFALLDKSAIRAHAERMIEEFDIRCQGPTQAVRRLSGGNQQKVCLARAFTLEPSLLFVSEPTRGVDVGAKDRVLQLLVQVNRERGTTIVLTSSELAELRQVSDRIAVVSEGRIQGILPPDAPDVEFGLLFAGGTAAGRGGDAVPQDSVSARLDGDAVGRRDPGEGS
ncbi:MAG: sugar ABC transporter ATP-binding protein [Candidatus Eisenbacteria bacterium]|uniref:Sugar ABC transporter ATP-binding protein n=1 Tax=Eiseniibacteriota bacterium TaxID=2212470 RepID=A0A956NAM5_UNCEI|nr:sugar ABC transporter ATP-binding protein [Candidatus Eisenbacteria bacterium]MCB9465465.1 sugar ABC transporter ATP-binding protein [Candidatus Eisenbacteria bacterium]